MKERHAQIIEAIKGFYLENGFCPTVRQIGDLVGLKSTSSTITHLKAMEEARSSEMEIEFDTVETSGTKYEAENSEGYYIRIYITEHKVEGGRKA